MKKTPFNVRGTTLSRFFLVIAYLCFLSGFSPVYGQYDDDESVRDEEAPDIEPKLDAEEPGPDIGDDDDDPGNEGTLKADETEESVDRVEAANRRQEERIRAAWERTARRLQDAEGDSYDWDVAREKSKATAEALRLMERKADRFRNHLNRMQHMHDVMQAKRNPQLAERLNSVMTLETLRFLLEFGELARENPEAAQLFDMEQFLPSKEELKVPGEALDADLGPFEKRLKEMGIDQELRELQGRTIDELQEKLERDYFPRGDEESDTGVY